MIGAGGGRSAGMRVAAACAGLACLMVSAGCRSTETVAPALGSLRVVITMTGTDVPRGGVAVMVDQATPILVPSQGEYRFAPLSVGDHNVTVSGVATNCTSTDPLTRVAQVVQDAEVAVTFTFGCTQAPLSTHGLIAFEHPQADGYSDIWIMNADGTARTNLTRSLGVSDGHPSWTPDGQRIVFVTHGESASDIAMMNRDGSGVTNITNDGRAAITPAVSPDGSRIAFAMPKPGTSDYDIWVMSIDGSNRVQLTADTAYEDSPAWSPDGRKIAFRRGGGFVVSDIYVMNADGTNAQRLSGAGAYDAAPAWSPDGSRIAFSHMDNGGQSHICTMKPDGSEQVALTSGLDNDNTPSWSGDGSRIMFGSGRGGSFGIWVMGADGTNLRRVSPKDARDVMPAWSR